MKRRDSFKFIPLTAAALGSFSRYARSIEQKECPEDVPLCLQYPINIMKMLTWIRENQMENMLEASYAISRTIRRGNTLWMYWDQGHSTNAEMFPGRHGLPKFCVHGYDQKKARKNDMLMISRLLSQEAFDDLGKKEIFVVGAPSPWSGDPLGFEHIRDDIINMRARPYADIWIETNITSLGGTINIPAMPAPIGPVSGPLYITIMWMILADACRVLSIEGVKGAVDGDELSLSGRNPSWVNTADPLMDNFLDEIFREIELVGAELGTIRVIASMAVDTLLNGGTVYYYSRYPYTFATENTGRRSGLAFAKGLSDGNISGTSKDCVIMGVYQPDDEVDLRNLDEMRKRGMKIASIGPVTRDFIVPDGRAVHKETDFHVGRTYDTYGIYALPGFDKKVCPTSGIAMFVTTWVINLEIIEQIRIRTGGNIPGVNYSGALKWGGGFNTRVRSMAKERGY